MPTPSLLGAFAARTYLSMVVTRTTVNRKRYVECSAGGKMEYASKKSEAPSFWLLMTLEATASQRDMPAKVGGKNDGGVYLNKNKIVQNRNG